MSVFCVISSVCLSVSDCAEMELDGENGRFIAEWLGYFCDACRMVYGGILRYATRAELSSASRWSFLLHKKSPGIPD
ncbi:uncharacterized protein BDW47DRAFT_101988 [Aspergillus candidus]|uniref:Secreted protein n=1 Tax=Aspergillus candidus TaxID=41067 RepID=A0A2I2FH64_ASPCN|nr:hypothetical protein BDW47DRAFT_101988 [Aspergillus candidus]PLB39949.1 hypothetical protein BDW47DRAFT_101988 [Aspergillus candidus]